ncbi:hypothetical protein [Bacillus phage FI_KG-Lek]|nr:hypothetical protein [Bacillus phage FI_KG-Lek]
MAVASFSTVATRLSNPLLIIFYFCYRFFDTIYTFCNFNGFLGEFIGCYLFFRRWRPILWLIPFIQGNPFYNCLCSITWIVI